MEREVDEDRNATIHVFFCGTSGSIEKETTQIGLFAKECIATDLMDDEYSLDSNNYKIYFDGCGVTNGMLPFMRSISHSVGTMGTLFASGLDSQCQVVVHALRALLKRLDEEWPKQSPVRLRLNCLGLSRGAIACLILARKVWGHKDLRERVDVNLCLFDPVPGNSLTSGAMDLLHATTAVQNMDLSNVLNVRRVVALYPHEPLPDLAFHGTSCFAASS
jgi:hypothetical protein